MNETNCWKGIADLPFKEYTTGDFSTLLLMVVFGIMFGVVIGYWARGKK